MGSIKQLTPLALVAFIASQDWKVRKSAYQQVQALFQQAQSPDDEAFNDYGERLLLMPRRIQWHASNTTCYLGVAESVAGPAARAHLSWTSWIC